MRTARKAELSEQAVCAWARLLRSSKALLGEVEAELQSRDLPPLSWYDVLLELRQAGRDGLRPYQLQERMLLAQYNLSRLIDRMASEGYVERIRCDEDRRGLIVYITKSGRALQRKMWPVYESAIASHFVKKLDEADIDHLATVLAKLIDR